jgi:hypothetical protein
MQSSIQDPPVTTVRGIDFCLEAGKKKIHFSITRAALTFLAGHLLVAENYKKIFETYRDEVEAAARQKYKSADDRRYRVVMNAHDLAIYAPRLDVSNETPAPMH